MKKTILAVAVIAALGLASVQSARAGDAEWAVAGKVLTGIAAASLITHAVVAPHVYASYSPGYVYPQSYAYAAPTYCPPPVRYCPPPVVYAPVYPRPAVVYRAPAYPVYAPAPVVGFNFAFGGGHNGGHDHHHW